MKFFVLTTVLLASFSLHAQSRRAVSSATPTAATSDERSIKEMFDEANAYTRNKFAEFEKKKLAFSDSLRQQTEREQKQLAAKYANLAVTRAPKGDDLYYVGLLHWIAESLDNAADAFSKFIASENAAPERSQTARSLIAVISAKRAKLTEQTRMANEIAKAFIAAEDLAKASAYAKEAYKAAKTLVEDQTTRARGMDELVDSGMLVFETYRDQHKSAEADAVLEDMQKIAGSVGSPTFFYYATDKLITYQIETDRKPLALETYLSSLIKAGREMSIKGHQTEVIERLKRREKHYKLLLQPAPEIVGVHSWFPGERRTLASLRGKVVLLDFWATWCAPCFDAFPALSDWHTDLTSEGLVILGVTRFYGQAEGFSVDRPNEIEFLKRFKAKQRLEYDFVVLNDQETQLLYGATALPTAVLIDRKGIIRYIEAGTSPSRIEDMRQMVYKLLAEK